MSIEKMSLVNISGSADSIQAIMTACSESGCFHPENGAQLISVADTDPALQDANPYSALLKRIADLSYKMNFKLFYEDGKDLDLPPSGFERKVSEIENKLETLRAQREEYSRLIGENEQTLIQLNHMKGLAQRFDDLFACEAVSIRFGILPNDSFAKLSYYDDKPFFFFTFDVDAQYHWGVYFVPSVMKEEIDEILSSLFFQRIRIPDYAHQTPDAAIESIGKMLEDYRAGLRETEQELKALTEKSKPLLRKIFTAIKFDSDTYELRKYAVIKNERIFLAGFVPMRESERFKARFDAIEDCTCSIREADADPRLTPPVKLKNNWFTRPFEMFVTMYGLPGYGDFDPTPLVAVTYCLLFGIMFGDLGQGLLLSVIGLLMWKLKKMMLGRILARVGIFCAFFGVVYGSVFGLEDLLDPFYQNVFGLPGKPIDVFKPETTSTLLLLAIGIGAVLITISIVINIIIGLRKRDWERSLFGHNGLAGLVFYVAVLGGAALLMIFNVNVLSPLFIIFCIVLPLVIILLSEPLAKLVSRRKGPKTEDGVGSFIVTAFFELFESVLSYITNTVSFLRVGGFVLSHAGMMAVVLTLMEMLGGVGSPIAFVIGNLFVMAMEGLIVGIQVLRLDYYEIFSRFYDGDGKEFSPVVVSYKIDP